jgi:hypothetical protein
MKLYRKLAGPVLAMIFGILASLNPAHNALAATNGHYSQAQLEQMLAPIALYPDSVLSHILIASTHPLDVIQAARWWQSNRDLIGESAVNAVARKDWDPSVKALVAFPEIIARMNDDLEWTEDLGRAFSDDEAAVMESIQTLREQAYAAGNLDSLEHFRIVRDSTTIVIEPTRTQVIFIPYYDSRRVYGDWRWHSHPPIHWSSHDRSHFDHGVAHNRFYWSTGVPVAGAFYFTAFQWHSGKVVVIEGSSHGIFSSRDIARHRDARHWNLHRADRHYGARAYEPRPDQQYHVRYGRPEIGARFRDSRRHQWIDDRHHGNERSRHQRRGNREHSDQNRRLIPQRDLLPPAGLPQPGPGARHLQKRGEGTIERRRALGPPTFTRASERTQ